MLELHEKVTHWICKIYSVV